MRLLLIIAAETILASAITFVLYGWDKRLARLNGQNPNSHSRISEQTLLIMSLIGGWPGGLIGSRVFRHKTVKQSYRASFYGVVGLHVGAVAALLYWNFAGGSIEDIRELLLE
ncbi:Uncharacterized membrane protein YsdA, DUF1294 family [Neorhodopirellula lusitana]|uniref:Uncharacterized membrane protein YsdA, DUF1294 family n=1 Tax=Neorhodopirellula lusitana TaxID=445327 RepID=A0ABY1PR25_9BACT|nr:DUF1294 domain-containing protein [Neorhodopirellula lusitana]SMP39591.1 Uncharacterized membrane protein YsdA, DUF1294 family [Neorhodopirellula lusitana]